MENIAMCPICWALVPETHRPAHIDWHRKIKDSIPKEIVFRETTVRGKVVEKV